LLICASAQALLTETDVPVHYAAVSAFAWRIMR